MALIQPINGALVGETTRLIFDQPTTNFDLQINGASFHATPDGNGSTYSLDLNELAPDTPILIQITYTNGEGVEELVVFKPRHDAGGMGATVLRDRTGAIIGTFFKFWLPQVKSVSVRGCFNDWTDKNRLNQLGDTGYWYGFSEEARPGDDYRFFVYGQDGNFMEVSDPAARDTIKTRHNDPEDAQDANSVIIDPGAFQWRHDASFGEKRKEFSHHIIFQLHWGTFLRKGSGNNLTFEPFTVGGNEEEQRESVRKKLQYVKDLGFTVIQLLPVHEANGNYNAGYDPSFFFAVESAYGQPYDLRILVDEAHGLGLAVVLDAVINHLTRDESHSCFSQPFIKGWYTRENAPWSNHNQWGGEDWGPDPDFDRPQVVSLLIDCVRMYFEEFHVDGIRFDATTTIPSHALRTMIHRLQGEYGDQGKYFIAEHLTSDPFPYIIGDMGFNAAWHRPAWELAVGSVLGKPIQGDLQQLRVLFETNYNGDTTTAIKYLLGSHDECWASHDGKAPIFRFGGSSNFYARSKMRLALALNVCAVGVPMLFMGTEAMTDISWHNYFGYNGHNDHTKGPGITWVQGQGGPTRGFPGMIRAINRLRQKEGALRTSNNRCKLVHYDISNSVAAYKRWDEAGSVLLIVINISDRQWESREYELYTDTPDSTWMEVFNSQDEDFGGWEGSGNGSSFRLGIDNQGKLPGINLPKWSLLVFKWQHVI